VAETLSDQIDDDVKAELIRYLSIKSCSGAAYFNSDKSIAFVTDLTGVPNVWALDISGNGWPYQLTFGEDRVSAIKPSSSREILAFTSDTGGNERFQISILSRRGRFRRRLTFNNQVIHNLGCWSPDDRFLAYTSNARDSRFYDVYVKTIDGSNAELVYQQDGNNYVLDWSQDGQTLLCMRADGPFDQHLYLLRLREGKVTELVHHEGSAVFSPAQFCKIDGRIYMVTDIGKDKPQCARMRPGDTMVEYLTNFEGEVEDMVLSSDGSKICITVNQDGFSKLWLVDTGSLNMVQLNTPPGVISSLSWSGTGRRLAFTLSSSRLNTEIWQFDFDKDLPSRVTWSSTAGIEPGSFVEPELFHTISFDGLRIPFFLYRPHTQPPYPTIFYIHGGPESQFRPSFNQLVQFMVSRGLAVVAPNFRGSTGYGRMFTHLDDTYKRMDTVKDVLAVVEECKKMGISDPRRLAVFGGSYGGFMVLACMYSSPDTWRAGVDVVGIANFVTFLKNTGPWRRKLRIVEYGDPDKDAEFLTSISPVTNAHRIKAPLFIIHGRNDPRVPVSETEQIVKTLQEQNKEVYFMVFDDEGHGLVKLKNRIEGYSASLSFLIRHLLP